MCTVTMPRDVWDDFMKQVNDRNIHKDIEKIQHEEIDRLRAEADQLKVKNDEMSTALGCIHVILTMSAGEDMAKIPQNATCMRVLERQKQFIVLKIEVEKLRNVLKNLLVDAPRLLRLARNHGLHEALTFANAIADAQAAIGRGHAKSQPVDRVIFDRTLAGLPHLNLRIPMPPVKKP